MSLNFACIHRLRLSLCTAVAMAAASGAVAQTPNTTSSSNDDQQLQEIVVTGSLLRRTDTETESPVTTFTAVDIKRTGFTSISDVIRSISADNSGTIPNAFSQGFAAGSSGVALRGLTVNSTLVLIDGRRVAPYALADDGERSFVDLNTIPLDSVERVEVLKDGASSIYGADAIAGVVNVILKKQYQGAEVNAEVGKGQHAGGGETRFTMTAGHGDLSTDRYNAYVNVEFESDARILVSDRGFPYNTDDLSSIGGIDGRYGTPGSFTGTTSAVVAPAVLTPGQLPAGAAGSAILNTTQVGAYRPLTSCGVGTTAASAPSNIVGATDNYCLQNHTQFYDDAPAQQRIGISGRFTVQINDTTQAYINASFYQNNTWVDAAPSQIQSPVSLNTNNIALPPTLPNGTLNPSNPFAAAGEYALINYAFTNIQNVESLKNHNMRFVTGLTGEVAGWNYDTAIVLNHTWLVSTQYGDLSSTGLLAAVQDGTYNFVNPAANGSVNASVAPALNTTSTTDMDSIDFKATRNVIQLPGGPLGVALGAEIRYEAQANPALNPNNNVQGLGIAQTNGTRNVGAAYFEFGLPVIPSLEFNVSGRFDHYSDFGSAFTPKAGFKWKPVPQLAVRGTYSKGFRAPSFAENGSSSSEGFVTVTPSAGAPFPANYCTIHSVGYCLPYSLAELSAANPAIKPEKSDSYTFGVILEPVTNFSVSADYYYIKKTNVIEQPNDSSALNAYLGGGAIPPGYTITPDLPDPSAPGAQPRPLIVAGLYSNENSLATDGLDIDLRATVSFGNYGQWLTDVSATKIFSYKLFLTDGTAQQYVGTESPYNLSSGAGTPRYKASWSNSYLYGPLTATITAYYVSGMAEEGLDVGAVPCIYTTNFCHVASFTYANLTGSYHITDHLTGTAAVENLLDRQPPINPANYAATNYNPTYSQAGIVGRYYKLGFGYKF